MKKADILESIKQCERSIKYHEDEIVRHEESTRLEREKLKAFRGMLEEAAEEE